MNQVEMLHGYYYEELAVGMSANYAKTITEADIVLFTGISGDNNPIHVNEDFAKATQFKGRIAPGILTISLISTALGTKLPGPGAIFIDLSVKFIAAVRIQDTVLASVKISKLLPEKRRVVFEVKCSVADKIVLSGEATMMVDPKPINI